MGWRWRYETADGTEVGPPPAAPATAFPVQTDAEVWVGEHWRELAEQGVDAVTLLEGDRVVYGPMSLRAEG